MLDPDNATASADRFKRGMVLLILGLALASTMAGWAAMGVRGLLTPALVRVQFATAVVLVLLLVTAWWKLLPQRVIELGCLLAAVVIYAACMALAMYSPRYGAGLELQPLYLWIPIVYVFAFTLTSHRTGLVLSVGILLLLLGISLPYLLRGGAAPYGNLTLQLHFVSAVLIAALYFFSGYQYRLRLAQRTVDRLAHLSNTDELTGLSNRRHMASIITDALARNGGHDGAFAVVLFDVDRFKAINDRLGHHAGDEVLVTLAKRAAKLFPGAGALGRWGGDEFLAVVQGVSVADATAVAEALRSDVAAQPLCGDCRATISCGVTAAQAGESISTLLRRADAALYAAKHAGRDRVEGVHAVS